MLLVWLPLNGNLNNQGLGNVASDDSSTSVYKDYGKLGSQSIDLATRVYFNCSKLANIQQWTVAFWGRVEPKEDSTTNWQDLFGFTDVRASDGVTGTFRFETGYASDAQGGVHFHDNATQATTNRAYTFNRVEVRNEWHHYAVTVSDTNIKAYYDGNLVDTSTVNGGRWNSDGRFYTGTTNALNGCIQDLRIWDEAISAAEVKNISQGLILHLPLSRDGLGRPNFLKDSGPAYTSSAITTDTGGVYTKYYYLDEAGTAAVSGGETVTVSFDYETYDATAGYVYAQLNGTIVPSTISSATFPIRDQSSGKYICTFVATSAQRSYANTFRIRLRLHGSSAYGYPGIGASMRVWNIKLEIGDKSTIWCPNKEDAQHLDLHYNNVMHDTSGYCHNGTEIGLLDYSIDSPRYAMSTEFDGDTSGILLEDPDLSGVFNDKATISFWVKPSGENGARSAYFSAYSDTSWSIEKTAGNIIRSWWAGSPDETFPSSTVSDDEWTMITVTKDGVNDMKCYINGELKSSKTTEHPTKTFSTTWRLGRDTRTGATSYKGLMSDFRIYATALSAEDVYNLYAVGASLSDTGVLFSCEVSDV